MIYPRRSYIVSLVCLTLSVRDSESAHLDAKVVRLQHRYNNYVVDLT